MSRRVASKYSEVGTAEATVIYLYRELIRTDVDAAITFDDLPDGKTIVRFDAEREEWRKRGALYSLYSIAELAAMHASELRATGRGGVVRRRWLTVEIQARDTWVTHSAIMNHRAGKIDYSVYVAWRTESDKLIRARKQLEDSRRRSGLKRSRSTGFPFRRTP